MPSNAFAAVGTLFQRGDGASAEAFSTIAEVNSIEGPGMTREIIDVTSLDSTGGYREYIAGFRDGGEVTLNMNFTYTTYNQMLTDYNDDDSHNYQIVWSDTGNTTLAFAAWVMNVPVSTPVGDKVSATITLKVTGAVTLTA